MDDDPWDWRAERARGVTRAGVVVPVRLDSSGVDGPTRVQARCKRWRRSSYGYYVPADVERTTDQRIVEAAMHVPAGHAITGWAALHWCGARWFGGRRADGSLRPVTIVIGSCDVVAQEGIAVSGERMSGSLVRWVDGVPVSDARYAVAFEMRYARSVREAAVVADMACYDDLVSVEEISAFLTPGLNGWTGVPRARAAVDLAAENSWSPMESWARLQWQSVIEPARLLCNQPVFSPRGVHVGTPDLLDPLAGVVGEFDGAVHLEREQRHRDIEKEAVYRDLGLEVVTVTAPDVAEPGPFNRRLREAYRRAGSRSDVAPCWTIEQPSGWIDTTSVAARRALTVDQRRRLLRYRSA